MNAIDRTAAAAQNAQAFLALFEARKQTLPGAVDQRDQAALLLGATGLPRRSLESWKYTDLRPLTALSLSEPPPPADPARAAALLQRLDLLGAGFAEADRLVFVNGCFEASLSRLPRAVIDVELGVSFGALAHPEREAMVALNTMLTGDGARLRVGRGSDAGRLLLILLGDNPDPKRAVTAHPRISVLLEENARLSLLEIALGDGLYVNNPVMEVEVRAGARLAHTLLQDESAQAMHFSTVYVAVDTGAAYDSFSLALGAGLARHEVHARLAGHGGEVQVNGAQLLGSQQCADLTSVITHDAPGCNSRQTVKNVLSGKARGVFQGKILVARAAQKTDGYQMNQALLLSDQAEINSKPELEIYADDVKCSHGATAGALDEDQLFYLRSRGVPADAGRALLVRAFLADALELIDDEPVRAMLEQALDRSWMGAAA